MLKCEFLEKTDVSAKRMSVGSKENDSFCGAKLQKYRQIDKNKYIRLIKAHFLSIIDACWRQAFLSARSLVYQYLTM